MPLLPFRAKMPVRLGPRDLANFGCGTQGDLSLDPRFWLDRVSAYQFTFALVFW
jgi:hypothetical protein